jgi:hypothetical protein
MCKQKYCMLFSLNHNRKPGPKGPSAELVHVCESVTLRTHLVLVVMDQYRDG